MRPCLPSAPVREVAKDLVIALLIFLAVLALALSDPRAALSAPAEPVTEKPAAAIPSPQSSEARRGTLYLHSRDGGAPLPVLRLGTDVEITVSGPIARAVVRQHFRNAGEDRADGVYVFPLPDGAMLDSLRMEAGARMIEGRIASREEAHTLYKQAKAQGADTSLIEQQRANVFTAPVADLGPGETVTVRIEYQGAVRRDGNVFAIRFPLTATPRDGEALAEPGRSEPVSLQVKLHPGFALGDVTSHHHTISIKRTDDGGAILALTDATLPAGKDFELSWSPNAQAAPQVAVFHEPVDEIDYVLATVTPPAADQVASAPARDVIFVVDTSSSMRGASLEQAKESLAFALDRLRLDDRVNVIRFGTDVQSLFKSPVQATPETIATARHFVDSLMASGGTDVAAALEAALTDPTPEESRLRQIVLITDDAISQEAAAFSTIASKRGRSRLFLVGIGSAPNADFMRRAAEVGRGTFMHIQSAAQAMDRLQELFRRLEHPAVTDLRADWTPGVRVEAWPDPLPDLYAGEPVVIAAQLSSLKGDLTLSGKLGGKPWKAVVKLAETPTGAGVAKQWARRKIAALEARHWSGQDHATIANAIRAVALAHRLVSAETSLVAVDASAPPTEGPQSKSLAMPLGLPAGWDDNAAFGGPKSRARLSAGSPLQLRLSEVLAPEPGPAADRRSGALAKSELTSTGVAVGSDHSTLVPSGSYGSAFSNRLLVVAVMAMFFAAMVAVTLGFWRHLSREYVSTRRPGRGI